LTRIIVAHRPETIASADRVIVLSKGEVCGEFADAEVTLENVLTCALRAKKNEN